MKKIQSKKSQKTQPKTLKHHVKHIWHVTPKFVHGAVAGAFIGIVLVTSLGFASNASALSIDTSRDCDDYAVIHCGALTTGELKSRYSNSGVSDIYKHFGISESEVNAMGTTAVAGTVYDSGRVTVAGKTVANDAITAARLNINGSTKVKSGSTTFYVRHVKVSFARKSSPAYVVMKNGQFVFAILASCGNPVIATPVPVTPPPPPPVTPPVQPPPPPPVTPPVTPPVAPPPVVTPPTPPVVTPASVVTTLPNAGPGALILIAALSIIGGYVTHHTHRHLKKKHAARQKATHRPHRA